MRKVKQLLLISLMTIMFLPACTVEKRVHLPGHHIDWYAQKHKPSQNATKAIEKKTIQTTIAEENNIEVQVATTNNILNKKPSSNSDIQANSINIDLTASVNNDFIDVSKDAIALPYELDVNSLFLMAINTANAQLSSAANTPNPAAAPGGQSQMIALILALVVGALGIHRFYLGYTGIGILMLLTGGVCGILLLIDIIRILTGDLKPKTGRYSQTL